MVSSALNTLRGTPQKQAAIYNDYLPAAAKIRMDDYLSGPDRLKRIAALVQTATNNLQGLLDAANSAEVSIRNKAAGLVPAGPASEVGEAVRDTIRDGYKNGLDLDAILNIIMQQNDRPALAALKSLVPYYERDRDRATLLIAARELQMYTRDELAVLVETYELDASMTPLRNNFLTLQNFFAGQLLPGAVQGVFPRPDSLYPWYGVAPARLGQIRAQGVEWESLPPDKWLLVSDFDQVGLANLAPTGGPGPQPRYNPAAKQYQQTGPNSTTTWQDKPLRGALP